MTDNHESTTGRVAPQQQETATADAIDRRSAETFARAYLPGHRLTIAFESAQVTYSDLPVDLYNSGVNQLLSVAATRRHRLFHFSVAALRQADGRTVADASILELEPDWDGGDPLHAYRHLRVTGKQTLPLDEVDLFILRADDVRNDSTPNLDMLRAATAHAKTLESVEATLSTTDKYATLQRAPQLPHPVTFAASTPEEALAAIEQLPHDERYFVLKDRFGYGCGAQVHRLSFDDPHLERSVAGYLKTYGHVLVQEFCPEVADGDIVVTFFDDELIGAMRRTPADGEWKTNASLGAHETGYNLTPEQESIARALKRSFPECRLASVDMLPSGRILEINAFPGGEGLLRNYGISIGELVMNRLETELLGSGADETAPAALSWEAGKPLRFPSGTGWSDIDRLYAGHRGRRDVYDVFSGDRYRMDIDELIEFVPRSPEYILSIPHAGVFVPEAFRDHFDLSDDALTEIDLYSDMCYEMAEGMHVRSELAPFFVDMNRTRDGAEEGELPRHLTNPADEYYDIKDRLMLRRPYEPDEREQVLAYYDVYHGILRALIDRMRRERGYALMFDCHSMTSTGLGRVHDKGEARDDFVVGTLEGTSAHRPIIDAFVDTLRKQVGGHGLGLTVARDVPYSGGFITRTHHNPDDNVHVIQLEIAMDTYMYEVVERGPKRYAIKRPRLRIVRRAVQEAFRAAAEEAERVYSVPAERRDVDARLAPTAA